MPYSSDPEYHLQGNGLVSRMGNLNTNGRVAIFAQWHDLGVNTPYIDYVLHTLSGNTGNMLFTAPLRTQLSEFEYVSSLTDIDAKIRTIVLSMGNWISPNVNLAEQAQAIECSNIERIVVVGAGAQAQADIDEIKLQPGTLRFLKLIAERSVSIGVRGDFTAAVLEKHGVKNIDVIGCPSLFMFDEALRTKVDTSEIQLAVNATWHGHYRDAIAELLTYGEAHDARFIEQSEAALLQFAQDTEFTPLVAFLSRYYSYSYQDGWRILDWWRRRLSYYTSLTTWTKAMEDVDLVIGPRFHGNVAGLLSGARSLFLTMDTRTKELVEYFNLPHIRFQDFDGQQPIEKYYEKADPSLFLATYPDRRARYQAFLLKNGLSLSERFGTTAPSDIDSALLDAIPEEGESIATARFRADARTIGLNVEEYDAELKTRAAPLRSLQEGHSTDVGEFVIPFAERIGRAPPLQRITWRRRQGVADAYQHQPKPDAYDDRGMSDQWQKEVYENAEHIARRNNFKRIVDFGCGSGFKLMKYFNAYETVGVDIDPTLPFLRTTYPDREWRNGNCIHPSVFDGDVVVCADVLEHFTEPDYLLQAMAASKARVFVLSTPALEILVDRDNSPRWGPPKNLGHVFEWTTTEFRALVSQHLTVVAHEIVNLDQATQMCIAIRNDSSMRTLIIPPITCKFDTKILGTHIS